MDLFDALAEDPDLHLFMDFEPGDIQLVHNHQILHDRTEFEDWPEPARKRHLLRLWLCPPDGRAASALLRAALRQRDDRRPRRHRRSGRAPHRSARLVRLPFFYGWVVVGGGVRHHGRRRQRAHRVLAAVTRRSSNEFGWERGLTAGAFAVGFMISAVGAPFLGVLMDTKGPRWMLSLGVVLVGGGMALATLITQPWHLYLTLGFLVSGGSVALAYTGHALFLPNWFVRRRALAAGIAFSGVGIGSIVMFPWLQSLIVGARVALRVRRGRAHRVRAAAVDLLQHRRPQDIGLVPDGDRGGARRRRRARAPGERRRSRVDGRGLDAGARDPDRAVLVARRARSSRGSGRGTRCRCTRRAT